MTFLLNIWIGLNGVNVPRILAMLRYSRYSDITASCSIKKHHSERGSVCSQKQVISTPVVIWIIYKHSTYLRR